MECEVRNCNNRATTAYKNLSVCKRCWDELSCEDTE